MREPKNTNFPVLVFDTETTRLPLDWERPVTDTDNWPRMIQLGMMRIHADGRYEEWCHLIAPPKGETWPIEQGASKTHGITNERCIESGVSMAAALEMFMFWAVGAKAMVAHNMSFDRPVVGCEFIRAKQKIHWQLDHYGKEIKPRLICTKESTTEWCKLPSKYPKYGTYKWPTLQELHTKLFGVGFDGAHDAMEDVRATAKCYLELIEIGEFTGDNRFLPVQV